MLKLSFAEAAVSGKVSISILSRIFPLELLQILKRRIL